jgi:hypothetical protein
MGDNAIGERELPAGGDKIGHGVSS